MALHLKTPLFIGLIALLSNIVDKNRCSEHLMALISGNLYSNTTSFKLI